MGRTKTVAVAAPQSISEARDWMSRIGNLERTLDGIGSSQSTQIAAIKEEHESRADPVKEELEGLRQGLQNWAEANKKTLTQKGKTFDLGTGKILWRMGKASVKRISKQAPVLEALKAAGLKRFIRIKEEVNKDAVLADPKAVEEIPGLGIQPASEVFVIEPIKEDVTKGEAA